MDHGDLAAALGGAPPPPHFLEATAALLLIGLVSALVTGGLCLTGEDWTLRARGSAALAIVAALFVSVLLVPLWRAIHPVETVAVSAGVVAVALGTWWIAGALRLRAGLLRVDRWLGQGASRFRPQSAELDES